MQLTTIFVAATSLAALTLAAPASEPASNVAARGVGDTWIFRDAYRTCNAADTSCEVHFDIGAKVSYPNSADRFPMPCTVTYTAANGVPASRALGYAKCGWFEVTSAWNAGGWTTFSLKDAPKGWITWPAWSDAEFAGSSKANPIKPDHSDVVEGF